MAKIAKITPNLWFDGQAEEAAKYYSSIFKNSKIGRTSRYGKEGFEIHKKPAGTILTIELELEGQKFVFLNGGPEFKFNESVSFIVSCKTQEEIDYYWEKLTPGGDPTAQVCGWLKDKFGLSWQIVPEEMAKLTADPDIEKVDRMMKVMFKMKKLDIAELKSAFKGTKAKKKEPVEA